MVGADADESDADAADAADASDAADEDEFDDAIDFEDALGEELDAAVAAEAAEEEYVFVVNPTRAQLAASKLDLVIAGTSEAVLMIEGFCDFLPEETLIEGLEEGLAAVRTICLAISAWAEE